MKFKKSMRITGALLALVMVFALMPAAAMAEGEKTPVEDVLITVDKFYAVNGVMDGSVDLSGFIKEGGALGELSFTDELEVMAEVRPAATANSVYFKFKGTDGPGEKPVVITFPVIMPEDSSFESYNIIIKLQKAAEEPETAETVTLSFDANGGSGSMAEMKAAKGEKLVLPENGFTAPEGKVFDGWDLGKPGEELSLTEDAVATAQWRDIKSFSVTVTYDYNDGSGNTVSETRTFKETEKPLFTAIEAPERKCWLFKGWEYEGQLIKPGESFTAAADMTLTAKWAERPLETYTIIFDANGGKDAPKPQSAQSRCGEVKITLTEDEPTRENMKFMGWSLSKTDGKVLLEPGEIAIVNDKYPTITLYAVWVDPNGNPKTGDESNIALWAALMAGSALAAGAAISFYKKKHE